MNTNTNVRSSAGCQNAAAPKNRPSTCVSDEVLQYQGS